MALANKYGLINPHGTTEILTSNTMLEGGNGRKRSRWGQREAMNRSRKRDGAERRDDERKEESGKKGAKGASPARSGDKERDKERDIKRDNERDKEMDKEMDKEKGKEIATDKGGGWYKKKRGVTQLQISD